MIKPTALTLLAATTTAWQGYAANIQIVAGKVYLTGELTANDGPVFQAQSADLPPGTTLVLKSMGGSIESAFRIGEVVWTRHFTTFVPPYCPSACAFAIRGQGEGFCTKLVAPCSKGGNCNHHIKAT
jgi:hypothetical protein